MKFKVAIVDDHKIFRDGFKLALGLLDIADFIGEASNGIEFLNMSFTEKPDVVFVDVNMPGMKGDETVKASLKKYPDIKFIALSSFDDYNSISNMIDAGVEGYMLKNAEIPEIQSAIEKLMSGKNHFSDDVLYQLAKKTIQNNRGEVKDENNIVISKRELEVLELLCLGLSVAEVSEKLHISSRTVEKHKEKLMGKSETKNTVNLILWALKNKIVSLKS